MNPQYNIEKTLVNRQLKAGECIFKEGEQGDIAYIIDQGLVEISTIIDGKHTVLNTLKEGEMFGELALVDGSPRSASAFAKTNILLTEVTNEQVRSRIDDADPILKLLLMVVMKYFRSETGRLRSTSNEQAVKSLQRTQKEYQEKIINAIELIRLESDLRNGFSQGELKTLFQPIIDLNTNLIAGFEILLRWHSEARGFIPPNLFIPLAESTSLIIPIGEWIFDQAIKTITEVKKETGYDIFLSVNVAEKQIYDPNFLEMVKEKISNSTVKPEQIKLEILERSLFEGEIATALVESCRDFGLPLVIDDFGTGYANLAYLTQFQFDTVKIDKCFIDKLENSPKDETICKALIELSQGLQMTTVAEGIENSGQLKILNQLGCNFGQGYLFSPPIAYEQAMDLIKKQCQQGYFSPDLC